MRIYITTTAWQLSTSWRLPCDKCTLLCTGWLHGIYFPSSPHLYQSWVKKNINMKQDRPSLRWVGCEIAWIKDECIYAECCVGNTSTSKKEKCLKKLQPCSCLLMPAADLVQTRRSEAKQWQRHQNTVLTTRRRFVLWGEDDEAKSFIFLPLQTDIIDLWGLLVCKLYPIQSGRAVLRQDRLQLLLLWLLFPLQVTDKPQIRKKQYCCFTKQLLQNCTSRYQCQHKETLPAWESKGWVY